MRMNVTDFGWAAALVLLSSVACGFEVTEFPVSPDPDTEVSTNSAISVASSRSDRLRITFDLTVPDVGCLEAAIGTDVDNDGILSLAETAIAFGCDCGTWFCRNTANDTLFEERVESGSRLTRRVEIRRRVDNFSWNLVKVTQRGIVDFPASVSVHEGEQGLLLQIE